MNACVASKFALAWATSEAVGRQGGGGGGGDSGCEREPILMWHVVAHLGGRPIEPEAGEEEDDGGEREGVLAVRDVGRHFGVVRRRALGRAPCASHVNHRLIITSPCADHSTYG